MEITNKICDDIPERFTEYVINEKAYTENQFREIYCELICWRRNNASLYEINAGVFKHS